MKLTTSRILISFMSLMMCSEGRRHAVKLVRVQSAIFNVELYTQCLTAFSVNYIKKKQKQKQKLESLKLN